MYYYQGFGLQIKSAIKFPELFPISQQEKATDLTITIGQTPTKLEGQDVIQNRRYWAKHNEFLLHYPGLARYYVTNGNAVTLEPLQPIKWDATRLFLLGGIMAAVLHQRKVLPLHASSIKHRNGLILFCGVTGSGKSTLIAHLQTRGYSIFCDDICTINPKELAAYPSYPMLRMNELEMEHLTSQQFKKGAKVGLEDQKHNYYFHHMFSKQPLPILHIFLLKPDESKLMGTQQIQSIPEKISELHFYTFRKTFLNGLGGKKECFSTLTQLAQKIPIHKISFPQQLSPSTLSNLVEKKLATL